MSYEYELNKKRLTIWFKGDVLASDIKNIHQEASSHQYAQSITELIAIFCKGTILKLTKEEGDDIAKRTLSTTYSGPLMKYAFIIEEGVETQPIYSLADTFHRLTPWQAKVFNSKDTAETWLNGPIEKKRYIL